MKGMQTCLRIGLAVLIFVGGANISAANDRPQENTIFQAVQQARNAKMTGMLLWLLDEEEADFYCIATSAINPDNEPEDTLLFFEEQDGRLQQREEEFKLLAERVMSLFLIYEQDDWHLVVYSLHGTGLMVRIFALLEGNIQIVFEQATRCGPEILDINNDGFEEVMLGNGAFLINGEDNSISKLPESASIYRWDGKQYTLFKTIPWEDRLCEGSRENIHPETRE